MCFLSIISDLSTSAMVLATFKMRSYARAESPIFSNTFPSISDAASVSGHTSLRISGVIPALHYIPVPLKRLFWITLASCTRWRISAEVSSFRSERRLAYSTGAASTWISNRSSNGPLILERYCFTALVPQVHSRVG